MSSIHGIAANGMAGAIAQLPRNSGAIDSDGDRDGCQGACGSGRTNRFAAAIQQALATLGIAPADASGTAADSSTVNAAGTTQTSQDVQQALSTFMHDLFGALHAQGTGANQSGKAHTTTNGGTDNDGDNDGSGSGAASGMHGYHHRGGGGMNGLESKLQNLIQQLATSDTTAGSASTPSGSVLQQDFSNLLASMGITDAQTTLSDFLGTLYSNLQSGNPGANVSTQA
jgi:hypothetical protein